MPTDGAGPLIDSLYEVAACPELWPRVLEAIAEHSNAGGAALLCVEQKQICRSVLSDGLERDGWRGLDDLWHAEAARIELFVRTGQPAVVPLPRVGAVPSRPGGLGAALVIPAAARDVVILLLERDDAGPGAGVAALALEPLLPHFVRCCALADRLWLDRARTCVETMSQIGLAAAVLTRSGRFVIGNATFEGLASGALSDRAERIALPDRRTDQRLAEAFVKGASRTARSIPVSGTPATPPLVLHLLPLQRTPHDALSQAEWMCVLAPVLPRDVPASDLLQGLFDLTSAEARVARFLGQGLTIEEIATSLGVSRETVRAQLKAVFAKTRTTRQAELVRLVGSAAPIGGN